MQVRNDEVELVLKSTDKATKGHEVWPTLSEAEWTQCEVALKDLIFASCGDQNKPSEISGSVLDILEKAAIWMRMFAFIISEINEGWPLYKDIQNILKIE